MRAGVNLQAPTRGCLVSACRTTRWPNVTSKRDALITPLPSTTICTATAFHNPQASHDWKIIFARGAADPESTKTHPEHALGEEAQPAPALRTKARPKRAVKTKTRPKIAATTEARLTDAMEANAVTWSRLRAWISEKEAFERATNKSAPLTSKEVLAIRALLPDLAAESDSEPEVGEKDWVSELLSMFDSP